MTHTDTFLFLSLFPYRAGDWTQDSSTTYTPSLVLCFLLSIRPWGVCLSSSDALYPQVSHSSAIFLSSLQGWHFSVVGPRVSLLSVLLALADWDWWIWIWFLQIPLSFFLRNFASIPSTPASAGCRLDDQVSGWKIIRHIRMVGTEANWKLHVLTELLNCCLLECRPCDAI
jgi:hypothetical protein